MQQSSDILPAAGGVKARLALYQEQCRKQKEVKKYEEMEVNKLNASLTDVSRFQSPTKRTPKKSVVITPTQGRKPAALAVFQLELSPSARGEDDDQNSSQNNPSSSNHNSSYRSLASSAGPFHASRRGMINSPRMPGHSDSSSGVTTPKSGIAARPGASSSSSSLQKPQQVKDEEEAAAKSELGKVLEAVDDSPTTKTVAGTAGEPSKEVTKASFVSVRSRYLMAVKKLAPVDIKATLSAIKDKDELRRQSRAAIKSEQQKKAKYKDLKSAWDQYEQTAQDKSRDPDDETEQEAREQLDKIEEAIDRQWVGFVEDVVEVVQKTHDSRGDDVGEEGDLDLLYWVKESKRLKAESVARRKKKIEQRIAEEEQYWVEEAIKLRDRAKLKRSPDKARSVSSRKGSVADDSVANLPELEESNNELYSYQSPKQPLSSRDDLASSKSLGLRLAEYSRAARSSPVARQGPSPEEVEARVEKYNQVRTRKLAPEDDEDEDDEDISFWISEAKRLQGKPRRSFRNAAEEEAYWVSEAKKLREAVRAGRGPNAWGEVDGVEQAILEERIERYNEIQTRKHLPEDDDESDSEDLEFWIQEAKRLRGDKKTKFRTAEEEEAYWVSEAKKLRESIRNGCGPNPYDFVHTVGARADDDSDSVLALSSSVRSLGSRVASYTKATSHHSPPGDTRATEERARKYAEIRTRKYVPDEDDDDTDLSYWIAEAKRLQGKPRRSFRNAAEEEAYWVSEAKKLRESIRNGTGPNPNDWILKNESDTVEEDETSPLATPSSSAAEELKKRLEKYNEMKTSSFVPCTEDDDLSFWIEEAKRLRGNKARAFTTEDEESAYWKQEALSLRESVRNGTMTFDLVEELSTQDSDNCRVHGELSELRHGFASPPRVKVQGRAQQPNGADGEIDELSTQDHEDRRVHGELSELRHGFASPPRVKVQGQAQQPPEDADDDNIEELSTQDHEDRRVHGELSELRHGFASPPRVKVQGQAPQPPEDADDDIEELSMQDHEDRRVHGELSELRHGFASPPRVKVKGQTRQSDDADDGCSTSDSDSSYESDGRMGEKVKKSRKHRKKPSKDSSDSGSSDESESDREEKKSKAKPKKAKKAGSPNTSKTPKSQTTGDKRSKPKIRTDPSSASSSNVDPKKSRSSKLKTYMENMPKTAAAENVEEVGKTEEPRNLDGSLWKNPLNRWTNRPTKKVHEVGTAITMKIAPKTDCWRKTRHNFIMDNAPYNWHKVSGDFEVMVKVSGDFSTMYDKAGLMVRQDEENWILTGMEYFNDRLNHSTSITRDFTDWSLAILPATAEKGAWFRLRRIGNSIETSYSFDTENWVITREGIFFDRQVLQVGICGASPMGRQDLKVTFEYYRVKSI